ncbi:unnamed protein product, partial [Prorocentrum cordatum]
VRLTGGEPTIRGDFARILEGLGEISAASPAPLELGLTTNGVRLKKFLPHLRAAGLRGINLSVDTLAAAKFPLLARRPLDWHARVMEAMRDVMAQEDHFRLKLNCVLLRGVNEDEIGGFVNLTEQHPVEVRFLEFMPFTRNGWSANRLVPQAEIVSAVKRHLERSGRGELDGCPPTAWTTWRGCGRRACARLR